MEKKIVCVSLAALYDSYYGNNLPSGNRIEASYCDSDTFRGGYYYDLYDKHGNLVCMDGEECEVTYELSSRMYKFTNRNGEFDTTFYLTKEEVDEAVFFDTNAYHYC